MINIQKYSEIYKEIAKLEPDDTLQLVLDCETEEEKEFYEMIGDYLIQKRQREVIDKNLF
jgi:hypothetical protein